MDLTFWQWKIQNPFYLKALSGMYLQLVVRLLGVGIVKVFIVSCGLEICRHILTFLCLGTLKGGRADWLVEKCTVSKHRLLLLMRI